MHVLNRWRAVLAGATLLTLLFAALPAAAQQTGTIRGRITSAGGSRALAGAQVAVVGTSRGTVTNNNGEFVITGVPVGTQSVKAQLIGYTPATQTVTVAGGQTAAVNLSLAEALVQLEEVVVTGTAATSRRREIGNSMAAINSRAVETAPVTNTQEIIGARAPGVTVMANSGQPGAGGTIRLRGNNSITQGNNPVIYVDGVRIFSGDGPVALASRQSTLSLNDIKAEDIERVEIIKGAAATTLYGTEASGGVIQIFTKKGVTGSPMWNAEVTAGINRMGQIGPGSDATGLFLKQCTGEGMRSLDINARSKNFGQFEPFVVADCPSSGSWLRDGGVQRYALSVRGGAEKMSYFVSANWNDENGVIETGFAKDGGARANFSFSPAKNLDVGISSSYQRRLIRWVPDGNNGSGFLLNVSRGPNGNFRGGKGEVAQRCREVAADITCSTPSYILTQNNLNQNDHFVNGVTVNWSPTKALSNRFAVGYDYNASDNQVVYPFGYLNLTKGLIWKQDWNHTKLSLDYAGSLQNTFGESLSSTFSWGGQLFEDRDNYSRIDGNDFSGPGDPTLSSAARATVEDVRRQRVVNAGVFLQEMVGWNDRLFVTAGLRVDGNSAFGEEFGLQPYPKLSASYVVSDHEGWPSHIVNSLKLRAAVGESGKAPGAFDAVRTWDPIAGDDGRPAVSPNQLGNPNLGPERTRETEFGLDLSALDGRVNVEYTRFVARTMDALIGVTYPPTQGFRLPQLENVGELQNEGHELQVDLGLLQNSTVDWRSRMTLAKTSSEVLDVDGRDISTGLDTYIREGFPVGAYFGAKIMNPDEIADPIVEEDQFLGNVYPTTVLGLGTTLTFRDDLTLDVLGEYQGGAHLANWVGYQNARRGVWQPCYDVQQKLAAAAKGDASALNGVAARERGRCAINRKVMNDEFWIEPSDFFKLRSVSLTYDLPAEWVRFGRSMSVTLAGRNLFRWTDYSGTDPEVQDARDAGGRLGRRDYYNLPPFRTFQATVRVGF